MGQHSKVLQWQKPVHFTVDMAVHNHISAKDYAHRSNKVYMPLTLCLLHFQGHGERGTDNAQNSSV